MNGKMVVLCFLVVGGLLAMGAVAQAGSEKPAVWDEKCARLPEKTERAEIFIDGCYGCFEPYQFELRIVQNQDRISISGKDNGTPVSREISPEEFRKYWGILRTQPKPQTTTTADFRGKLTVTVFNNNASETVETQGDIPLPVFGQAASPSFPIK